MKTFVSFPTSIAEQTLLLLHFQPLV